MLGISFIEVLVSWKQLNLFSLLVNIEQKMAVDEENHYLFDFGVLGHTTGGEYEYLARSTKGYKSQNFNSRIFLEIIVALRGSLSLVFFICSALMIFIMYTSCH